MKAIVVDKETPNHPLSWEEVPDPEPGPREVLVDVYAAAVNRADLLQRAGHYPPPPGAPETLGLEMAGVVTRVGAGVERVRQGQRVCALLSGGGYAEQVVVDERLLIGIPEGWDFTKAAAVPEVFLTAYVNLFDEAGLQGHETVLVHGGGSGVGTAAIQLARHAGCRVLATAGAESKRETCRRLGAELAVDYRTDFAAAVAEHLGEHGVDVVLDVAGASHLGRNLDVMSLKGRLVLLSLLGGAEAQIDLGMVLRKRLRIIGSLLRSRPVEEKESIIQGFATRFMAPLIEGRIEPVIDRVVPIEQTEAAHAAVEGNENTGKVILKVREDS
jgi:putative PIG3 family NAD(P)H quinone oxidoreductase